MGDYIQQAVAKFAGEMYSRRYAIVPPKVDPKPVQQTAKCDHQVLELYSKPCLNCNVFCNCNHTYFPKYYPDVLVRSVDKHIVQLSGNLVRASETLRWMVDQFTAKRKSGFIPPPLEKETVIVERKPNNGNSVVAYKTVGTNGTPGGGEPGQKPTYRLRDTAKKFHAYQREKLGKWEDLIEIDKKKDTVFVLFDEESDQPTLGVSRNILEKVDYFINMHLDDVDMRVETKKRNGTFREKTRYKDAYPNELLEEMERMDVNTFRYEDWEEEFFNVDCRTFFDLHQANQELLIWDLFLALEKWVFLARGFPQGMVNGEYDIFSDPEFDKADKKNVFGLFGIAYPNPYRRSFHLRSRMHISFFNRVRFTPRWWSINRQQDGMWK